MVIKMAMPEHTQAAIPCLINLLPEYRTFLIESQRSGQFDCLLLSGSQTSP